MDHTPSVLQPSIDIPEDLPLLFPLHWEELPIPLLPAAQVLSYDTFN